MQKVLVIAGVCLAVAAVLWIVFSSQGTGGGGGGFVTLPSGLKYQDIVVGKGKEAKVSDAVQVHYTGKLANGTKFDSSLDRGEPFTFTLGEGQVIKGWDQGVAGMKVGGKRKLVIPSELGYGPKGAGKSIPPDAELHFEVELLRVTN